MLRCADESTSATQTAGSRAFRAATRDRARRASVGGQRAARDAVSETRPAQRCRVARCGSVGIAQPADRRPAHCSHVAVPDLCGFAQRRRLRRRTKEHRQSVLHRRSTRADSNLRVDRRVDFHAQCVRGRRRNHGGRRRGGELRAREKPAPRREGRRSQLSRHVGLRRLAVDLDAQDERDRSARRLRPDGMCRSAGAATRGDDRSGRDVDRRLRRGDDQRRTLRARRRLRHGRRRRPHSKRRVRKLFEEFRYGGRRTARSRDRHRGRHRANRERLHARRLVLGHQRRRRRKPRRRYEAHAANARAAGVFRGRQSYREGELRRRVSQVDRSLRRLLRREFVQRALGRKRPLRPR